MVISVDSRSSAGNDSGGVAWIVLGAMYVFLSTKNVVFALIDVVPIDLCSSKSGNGNKAV